MPNLKMIREELQPVERSQENPDMCGCHGNAWRSSSENSIFSQRHVILVLCAKFHANRVKTAEAKGK